MATLDNINIFANGGPAENTIEDEYQKLVAVFESPMVMGTPPTFEEFVVTRQKSQAADVARQTMLDEIGTGNVKKAYEEGFTQLPMAEQMAAYVFPPTGVPIEAYETGYFTDKAGFEMKNLPEFALDVLNPNKNILQKLPFKAEDPMSAVLAKLSALGMLGGIGELANIPKAAILMGRRMNQKTMDGGGGGIGGLTIPNQEPTRDLAGYKSNTLEEAKSVSAEMSPKALLQYIKSNKRTNPSSNKTGTALKQTEINEIDFEVFEAQYPNKDYTNEDILKYIDDNRVQLYRVSRREDNPTYKDTKGETPELSLDEPMTSEIRAEKKSEYMNDFGTFFRQQKEFITSNFPDGINLQNYKDFVQRQKEVMRGSNYNEQDATELVGEFLVNNDSTINPFAALGKPQYDVYTPSGTLVTQDNPPFDNILEFEELLDAGYTFKPKISTEDLGDDFLESAADGIVGYEYDLGDGVEAYRYVSDNNQFEVTGNASSGFYVKVNGEIDNENFGSGMSFDEARLQIGEYEGTNVTKFDDPSSEDYLIDLVPDDVISGKATIPTKYEGYDGYKLPMGGAVDYEEHTLHLANPKTPTRYTGNDGTKHFGGGDELLHYRTTIRTDENGKKVLFVEEIQSDLHSTARSNKTDATYELSEKEYEKTRNKVNSIEPSRISSNYLQGVKFDKDMPQFNNISHSKNPNYLSPRQIRNMGDVIREKNGLKLDGVGPQEVIARFLVDEYGKEKILALVDAIEPISSSGNLPDFPYKKDWVDAAVKDAIKLGAELGVDRVSFTNASTQIQRNNKNLNYVQDTIITKVPTREEILASPKFARDLAQDKKMYYDDYVNNTHNTNLPIPTMDEYYSRPSMGGEPFVPDYTGTPMQVGSAGDMQTNLDTVKEITYRSLARDKGVGQYRYRVEDVGYNLRGDEILNPSRTQMEGDDYVEQRMNNRMLQSDEELLAEIPEKYKEQVMKDLASGKQEITLNIDDIDGSGKKFLEIYKNEIPRGINKVLKDLKVKDAKPDISNILYASDPGYDPDKLFTDFRYLKRKHEFELDDFYNVLNQTPYRPTNAEVDVGEGLMLHKSIGIDLTDEMKKKIITEGFASMYMGGKVSKSNSMDRPIVGNRREM